ncbi:hypothetical protein JTB14_017996 [Gonioctena quinquepunctata]|nr:hypothetical protein JTB14_017996 [Gonioctena quinquepunctata]
MNGGPNVLNKHFTIPTLSKERNCIATYSTHRTEKTAFHRYLKNIRRARNSQIIFLHSSRNHLNFDRHGHKEIGSRVECFCENEISFSKILMDFDMDKQLIQEGCFSYTTNRKEITMALEINVISDYVMAALLLFRLRYYGLYVI